MYNRILVPVDGSETADLGLAEAIKLAKHLRAQMRIVHVVDELPLVTPGMYGAVYDQVIDGLRDSGAAVLKAAHDRARQAEISVDTQLVEAMGGLAGEHVIRVAKEWKADLIVCGTHGRRGLRRIVMGSDAEYILRHTPVPVLLVRSTRATG